jgi:hypothetical protein
MTTAIIGTGGIGSAIACRLASGGETLRLSSADRESARKLAAEIGDAALVAGDNRDALQGADAVLALRFTVLESVIDEMADSLTDKVVVVPSNDGPDALVHASREGREIGTAPGLTATSALGPRQGRASLQMMLAAADLGDRSGSRSGPWTSRGQDGPIHHRRRPPLRSAVALIQKPNRHGGKRFGSGGIERGELFGGHLEGVGRFRRRAGDQPERVGVGVVEDLAHASGIDEQRGERVEGQELVLDSDASGAFQHDVELVLGEVTVTG